MLCAPLPLPLFLPFVGIAGSILSFAWSGVLGPRLWRGTSRAEGFLVGGIAVLAFWAPVVLAFSTPTSQELADRAGFMLVPLCAPDSLLGYLLPALAGLTVYAAVSTTSVVLGRSWLWPIAALLTFPATAATWGALVEAGAEMVC